MKTTAADYVRSLVIRGILGRAVADARAARKRGIPFHGAHYHQTRRILGAQPRDLATLPAFFSSATFARILESVDCPASLDAIRHREGIARAGEAAVGVLRAR